MLDQHGLTSSVSALQGQRLSEAEGELQAALACADPVLRERATVSIRARMAKMRVSTHACGWVLEREDSVDFSTSAASAPESGAPTKIWLYPEQTMPAEELDLENSLTVARYPEALVGAQVSIKWAGNKFTPSLSLLSTHLQRLLSSQVTHISVFLDGLKEPCNAGVLIVSNILLCTKMVTSVGTAWGRKLTESLFLLHLTCNNLKASHNQLEPKRHPFQ